MSSRVWRALRAPFVWLGPQAARSGASVYRRTWVLLATAIALANLSGAVVVFVFSVWVLPIPDTPDSYELIIVNLAVASGYMLGALAVGLVVGTRRLNRVRPWLREERPPDDAEQRLVLRGPLWIALIATVLWSGAVVVFTLLNLFWSVGIAMVVGVTIALGGLTTSAAAYLLSERMLRAITARALAPRPPERPLVPGVIARSLLAWAVGTGVPVAGLLAIAVLTLAGADMTEEQIAITILGLGGVALAVGFILVLLAARAASDPIVSVRDAVSRVEKGDLDTEVPIYDGSEVGLLQAGFNRMVAGLRERERLREAFGTYMDPAVAEHVLDEGVSLEGEEVEVTLMFLDVCDFTGWAERRPASEVVEELNRLFERVVPIVHEHGGHVDKFVGDGLLAVFGAPRRAPDHADRALAAACDVARAANDGEDGDLRIGIGLNSGRVVAGNVGGGGRFEFSVIGDAVNVAARIQDATRETGDAVLLSEDTVRRLERSRDGLKPRSGMELRGRRERVELFAAGP